MEEACVGTCFAAAREAEDEHVSRATVLSATPLLVSHDTVETLERLLNEARSGVIVGLAFAAMCRQREFITAAAGAAYLDPVFARGMVAALDEHLGEVSRGA